MGEGRTEEERSRRGREGRRKGGKGDIHVHDELRWFC